MVYISGKITGNKNYEAEFNEAEIKLRKMGFKVFNPASIKEDWTYEQYMKCDLKHLLECDWIYFLPNWETSRGARIEKIVAEAVGIKVLELKQSR